MNPSGGDTDVTVAPDVRRSAALWGVFATLWGLCLALVTAEALNSLAAGRIARGVAILAMTLIARWLATEQMEEWFTRTARRLRHYWRSRVVDFFLVAGTSARSPVEIVGAIETVADEPRLGVVRASAQSSIVALVVVFVSGGWQALGIVVALLAIAIPLYQRAGKRAAALADDYRQRRATLGARQLELLLHAPELRGLGAVEYAAQEIAALSSSEHEVALRAIRVALGSSLVTEFLGGVSVGLVAMDVGFGLLGGHISLLRALISVLVTNEFFGHVRRYGVEFHRREAIDAAASRLELRPVDIDHTADVLEAHGLVTQAHPGPITLTVAPGDRVAVTGASGVGKTTLAHTLLGWRAPREGHVQRTADALAYVSANTSLLEGTLRENLGLGRDVSDEEILELLHRLGLEGNRFERLDTGVDVDGEGFSSGERVRLLIARGLLHRPRLLIVDDLAGLLDEAARSAIRDELRRHPEMAVVEITVDDPVFISASTTLELS